MIKAEQRPMESLVTPKEGAVTPRFLVAHFGNGDEDDQTLIQSYASQFGKLNSITIFPGISYGHIEFSDPESGARMMSNFDAENIKVL